MCLYVRAGGRDMVFTQCPGKYWAYNFICAESVCGYGNRSTEKLIKWQGEGF